MTAVAVNDAQCGNQRVDQSTRGFGIGPGGEIDKCAINWTAHARIYPPFSLLPIRWQSIAQTERCIKGLRQRSVAAVLYRHDASEARLECVFTRGAKKDESAEL